MTETPAPAPPVGPSPPEVERPPLPPDPAAYDSERNARARRKGLPQAYIAGGTDPELAETLGRERRYVRLLLWMVACIIALGFVLGIIGAIITGPA